MICRQLKCEKRILRITYWWKNWPIRLNGNVTWVDGFHRRTFIFKSTIYLPFSVIMYPSSQKKMNKISISRKNDYYNRTKSELFQVLKLNRNSESLVTIVGYTSVPGWTCSTSLVRTPLLPLSLLCVWDLADSRSPGRFNKARIEKKSDGLVTFSLQAKYSPKKRISCFCFVKILANSTELAFLAGALIVKLKPNFRIYKNSSARFIHKKWFFVVHRLFFAENRETS